MARAEPQADGRARLLGAAVNVIRAKGYAATTVDDICSASGLTKGGFFHHFKSKEELAVAAAEYWSDTTGRVFDTAAYHSLPDPLDRVLGYVAYRKSILNNPVAEFTCLVGTMVQEIYDSYPAIRVACERSIYGHVAKIEADISEAMRMYKVKASWSATSLALHTQAVLQGAFILAKAKGGSIIAADTVDHLYRYIELLFGVQRSRERPQ